MISWSEEASCFSSDSSRSPDFWAHNGAIPVTLVPAYLLQKYLAYMTYKTWVLIFFGNIYPWCPVTSCLSWEACWPIMVLDPAEGDCCGTGTGTGSCATSSRLSVVPSSRSVLDISSTKCVQLLIRSGSIIGLSIKYHITSQIDILMNPKRCYW